MITVEELVQETDNEKQGSDFKLGEVVGLFDNQTAKIKFDGEELGSEKEYAYLDSYIPREGDRVLLGVISGTYIILGRVKFNKEPDKSLEDLRTTIGTISGDLESLQSSLSSLSSSLSSLDSDLSTLRGDLESKYPHSNMKNDSGGNMNINYMYVDPQTGELQVRRRNGLWTTYAKV